MTDSSDDLLDIFWVEAAEYLETLNRVLLRLEMLPPGETQRADLREVSRVAHSLKGAARVVGQTTIETLAHQMEGVFDAMLDGRLAVQPEVCDALYDALDLIQAIADGREPQPDLAALALEQLNAFVAASGPVTPAGAVENRRRTLMITPLPLGEEVAPLLPTADDEDTIRVRVAKLDRLMGQASELLVARMHNEQRREALRALLEQHRLWQRRWRLVRTAYIRAVRRLRQNRLAPDGRSGTGLSDRELKPLAHREDHQDDLASLLDFLSGTEVYMAQARRALAGLSQALAEDALHLATLVDELQADIASTRMLPFATILGAFQRLVRDLARDEGKDVTFVVEGAEVELDKHVLELLKDPLLHLLRNAVGHGIESPAERTAAGKPAVGTVRLSVSQRGNDIQVSVGDDGRGIHPDVVRARAVQAGIVGAAEADAMTPDEAAALIFVPGFSTVEAITAISGRGVGLDVVQQRAEALRGRVWLENVPGAGATFHLLVPVSLTRLRCLLARAGDQTFAIPLTAVARIVNVAPDEVFSVEGRPMMRVMNRPARLLPLAEVLELPGPSAPLSAETPVLVLQSAERAVALILDELLSEQELVLKKLGPELRRVRNVAGAAILGTGEVVIVLNTSDLIKSARRAGARAAAVRDSQAKETRPPSILVVDDSLTTRTLEKNILEAAGYRVHTATDGDEALRALLEAPPDLIVTDVQMPGMDGFELTRRVKNDTRWGHIPIIIVTSRDSPGDREQGLHAGADAYLVKPQFDQDELLQMIQKMV